MVCDECDAVWPEPQPPDSPLFPPQPDLPCPVCGLSLWGPQAHWAGQKEVAAAGWSEAIVSKTSRATGEAAPAVQPLRTEIVGHPETSQPFIECTAESTLLALAAANDGCLSDDATIDATILLGAPGRDAQSLAEVQEQATLQMSRIAEAIRHGRHVLADIPWAPTAPGTHELIEAADAAGVSLRPARTWRHHPRTISMKELASDSGIGQTHRLTIAHSVSRMRRPVRLLLQHALEAVFWLLDRSAGDVLSTRVTADGSTGLVAILEFPGTLATLDISNVLPDRQWVEIAGPNGSLVCDDLCQVDATKPARFWIHGGKLNEAKSFEPAVPEAECLMAFARSVLLGDLLADRTILDAAEMADVLLREAGLADS